MGNDEIYELAKQLAEEFLKLGTRDSKRYFWSGEVEGEMPEGKVVVVKVYFESAAKLANMAE